MNVARISILSTLLSFALCWVVSTHVIAGDSDEAPKQADAKGVAASSPVDAEGTTGVEAKTEPLSSVAEAEAASDKEAKSEPGSPVTDAEAASEAEAKSEPQPPAADEGAASAKEATPEKSAQPVTGAFGMTLGERFDPAMVAKVISQEERVYTGREKAKFKGTRYQVEPKAASEDFEKYWVDTTDQGIIYAIQGEYLQAGKGKECKKVTKRLATGLEAKYGKPRGKGMHGEWYSFRDMSRKAYRGVRLYANRCGSGRYSIVYSDDQAKLEPMPPPPVAPPSTESSP